MDIDGGINDLPERGLIIKVVVVVVVVVVRIECSDQ